MSVSAGPIVRADQPADPDWSTAQKAMRSNAKYVAALEQIKIISGRGTPAYQVADAALRGN